MDRCEPTTSTIRMYKEQWIDKLRYKKIKLQKMFERGKRIRDNATFERDQKSFFRKIESSTGNEGQIPKIEKFVEFWGGIWEKEERTPEMPWMEKVQEDLTRKIKKGNVFDITWKSLTKESNKNKN